MRDQMNIFLNYWLLQKILIIHGTLIKNKSQQEDGYHNKPHFALYLLMCLRNMYVKVRSAIVERNEKAVLALKGGRCEQKYFTYVSSTDIKVESTKTSYEKSKKGTILHMALIVIFFLGNIPINLYAEESKAKRCKGEFRYPLSD